MPRIGVDVSPVSATAPAAPAVREIGPLMGGTAWVPGGLTFVDAAQAKRVVRNELSISTSHSLKLDSCAVSMVADRLLPRDDDVFEANQLGTAAHGAMEILFGLPKADRTKDAVDDIVRRFRSDADYARTVLDADLVDRIHALDGDDLERWYEELRLRTHGVWAIHDPRDVDVYATELGFGAMHERAIKIGNVPFIGFIDRVDEVRDEHGIVVGYAVVDLKFGKYKEADRFGDDYGDQIKVYARAVETYTGKKIIRGDLHFGLAGKGRAIPIDKDAVDAAVAKFERAYERMLQLAEANFYPAKTSPLCGWCPLVNACPSAQAEGMSDLSHTEKVNGRRQVVEGKKKRGIPAEQITIPTLPAPLPSPLASDAAHREITSDHAPEGTATAMTETTAPRVAEGNGPREDTANGALNGNSFAAIAVWGLSSLAVETLAANGQPVVKATVTALAQTLASITQSVQSSLSGQTRYGDGLNTRIRGALHTAIETLPAPWGGDSAAWGAWVGSVTNRTRAISIVALELFEAGTNLPANPWEALATPAAPAAVPAAA